MARVLSENTIPAKAGIHPPEADLLDSVSGMEWHHLRECKDMVKLNSTKRPVSGNKAACDGQDLCGMFAAASRWLEHHVELLNSLNVFPVPDGDTGANMRLTMKAALEQAGRCRDRSAEAAARALARGALMGARGNSGVILSQIFGGLAQGLRAKSAFDGKDLAAALEQSSAAAYKGVSKPVEGTMLTVIRDAAAAARTAAAGDPPQADVGGVMEATVREAGESVARTPSLLPVLRQAGVVDAGGQGLYFLLEGALKYLKGESVETGPPVAGRLRSPAATVKAPQDNQYGYCTEFLLQGKDLDLARIREKLVDMGKSVLAVGDDTTVRVHVHTFDPGAVLSYGASLGTVHQIKVDNMQEQHRDFVAAPREQVGIATIAVASGEGLAQALYSIGATLVVSGGETMNPSVSELLKAVEEAPSDQVILLPDNHNILMAAGQVPGLTSKRVIVVPAETVPQGIAALLAFNVEADMEANAAAMKAALSSVRTGEVTTAVRSMKVGDLTVKKGQAIAFLDGELVAAAGTMPEAVFQLLAQMKVEGGGLVSVYYGAETGSAEAQKLGKSIRARYPGLEVEVVAGGQPHYNYIISYE